VIYICHDTLIGGGRHPFANMIENNDRIRVCPLSPCFPSRVFNDIEKLCTHLYLDLNCKGKLQGGFDHTYNPISFSSESWMHFKYKLCDWLGIQLPCPVKQRIFRYHLDDGMDKMKYKICTSSYQLIRIKNEADLGRLRLVLIAMI
jgi:hypothetical protein